MTLSDQGKLALVSPTDAVHRPAVPGGGNILEVTIPMKIDPITLKMLLESMNEGAREMHLLLRGAVTHETVKALARVAHKLKGEATVVGLGNLSHLITGLEDSLERIQGQKKTGQSTSAGSCASVEENCESM